MNKLFRKAKQNRIFQDVVEQVQTAILEGTLTAGDKLAPERELVEMFQTSRGTLREALRILEQKGLIEIRLGINGGAYVRDANAELMAENLAMLIRSHAVSLDHLAEFREGVEGTVAGLAARRRTENDTKRLSALLSEATQLHARGVEGWDDFVRIDEKIHTEIARIAGNKLYIFVLESIHKNMHRYYDKFLNVGDMELEENFNDLKRIIEAVIAQDHDGASREAVSHVHRFTRHMEKKKRQTPDL